MYRHALRLSTTEAPSFLALCRSLNQACKLPSRFSIGGPLLERDFAAKAAVVNAHVSHSASAGDIFIGGDGSTDSRGTSSLT